MSTTVTLGFSFRERKDGAVAVCRHGRQVKELRGAAAARLLGALAGASDEDVQLKLAKVTGQYRFGNERAGAKARKNTRRG